MSPDRPSTLAVAAAFGAIYVIWGCNFLALRIALETIPPFVLMGIRSLMAGLLLVVWSLARGGARPGLRESRGAILVGSLLFLAGHGSLAWGQQHIATGLAALLMSTIPVWVVLLEWQLLGARRPRRLTWLGLALGLVGIVLLVRPGGFGRADAAPLVPAVVLLASAFAWAVGSVGSRLVTLPRSVTMATGMQLTAGGTLLCVLALLTGELAQPLTPSARSLAGIAYMMVMASIVTFTAYMWLLRVSTPGRVASYAFINPLVAVLVGWAFAGEPLTGRTLSAAALIVSGVILIVSTRSAGSG